LAQSSRYVPACGMAAFGGKADIKWSREKSPLLTQSGHSDDNKIGCW
jgi:hypothetical protein